MIRPAAFLVATLMVFVFYLRRSPGRPLSGDTEAGTVEIPAAKDVDQSSLDALESYQLCVDAIMTNKSSAGCVKKSIPDRMLYIVIGDSTARQHAKGVNKKFPNFKFNGEKVPIPTDVTGDVEMNGKKVEVVLAMLAGLRHHELQDDLSKQINDQVKKHGIHPSVVVFSGVGLHECAMSQANKDPFWLELRKTKLGNITLPRWKIDALSMDDYHQLQEPCTLSVLKQLRIEFPKTTFLWRPIPSPVALFMGSLHDKLGEKKCTKMDKWRTKSSACGKTHAWHMQLKPKLREIGFGILDYASVYPEHCALSDTIHLSRECHLLMTERVMATSQLVIPNPKLYLDEDVVAAQMIVSCPLVGKLQKVKALKKVTREQITALQATETTWANVRCADFLNTTAYDPYSGEFFKPSKEDIEAGRRVTE